MRQLLTAAAISVVALVVATAASMTIGAAESSRMTAERTRVHAAPLVQEVEAVSDAPPSAGGVATGVPPFPVTVTVEQRAYAVHGRTEDEILSSLRASGPNLDGGVFFGLTVAENEYRFRYRVTSGFCETVDARVTVQVSVTVPAWQPPTGAPAELRRQWARFDRALRGHEYGHRDLAIAGANRLHAAVQGVRAPTCDEAADRAGQLAARVQIETEARHREYDEETDHGATQGASWP